MPSRARVIFCALLVLALAAWQQSHLDILDTALGPPPVLDMPTDTVFRGSVVALSGAAPEVLDRVQVLVNGHVAGTVRSGGWSTAHPLSGGGFTVILPASNFRLGVNLVTTRRATFYGRVSDESAPLPVFYLPKLTATGFVLKHDDGSPASNLAVYVISLLQGRTVLQAKTDPNGAVVLDYREPERILNGQGTPQVVARYQVFFIDQGRLLYTPATYSVTYAAQPSPRPTGAGGPTNGGDLQPVGDSRGEAVSQNPAFRLGEHLAPSQWPDACGDHPGWTPQGLGFSAQPVGLLAYTVPIARLPGAPNLASKLVVAEGAEVEFSGVAASGPHLLGMEGGITLNVTAGAGKELEDDGTGPAGGSHLAGWYRDVLADVTGDLYRERWHVTTNGQLTGSCIEFQTMLFYPRSVTALHLDQDHFHTGEPAGMPPQTLRDQLYSEPRWLASYNTLGQKIGAPEGGSRISQVLRYTDQNIGWPDGEQGIIRNVRWAIRWPGSEEAVWRFTAPKDPRYCYILYQYKDDPGQDYQWPYVSGWTEDGSTAEPCGLRQRS